MNPSYDVFEVSTTAQGTVRVLRLDAWHGLREAIQALGVPAPRPALALVGGAGSIRGAEADRLRPLFVEGLAPAAARAGAVVVDGGTDAGVMRLAGEARAQLGGGFPLVGVAAAATIALPEAEGMVAPDAAPIEPHHSHLLLVPGRHFGEESPWIAGVAGVVAGGGPSVTVLIGGGDIAWEDVEQSVAAGRAVILVDGSGGTADALAETLAGRASHARAARLPAPARFHVVRAGDGPAALREAIEAALIPTTIGQ